jgi:hypothetical protein
MDPVCNAAVQNWHSQTVMRPDGSYNWKFSSYDLGDTVQRLAGMHKQIRGVTGMWLNSLPPWHPQPTMENLRKVQVDFANAVAVRYPEIKNWQIVSEPNGSWDNLGFLEPEQIIELGRAVAGATRRVRPEADRAVNTNLPWGEDAAAHWGDRPRVVSASEFYQMAAAAGLPYERIVIQLYHEGRDLFEIDQRLERLKVFGKPIQVELAAPSCNNPRAPGCRHFPQGHPRQTIYRWHRPWDRELQAEWLEGAFTILMSKDYLAEFCWWDLADYEDCYIPWGGLLDQNYRPKPAYDRLQDLVKRWGHRAPGFGKIPD